MDPNAAYEAWKTACSARDWESAREHGENLREWVRKGGFQPAWSHADAVRILGRDLCARVFGRS